MPSRRRKTSVKKSAARKSATKARAPSDREAVLAAARQLAAATRSGDKAAAGKLLAPDFGYIDASGEVLSRPLLLGHLKDHPIKAGSKVKSYGRVALVTGSGRSGSASEPAQPFTVEVWVAGKSGWRALIRHDNVLAEKPALHAHTAAAPRPPDAPPPECKNPLELVPYEPKSRAERDIITAFQALEKAVTHNDPDDWPKHIADEFVVYRTRQYPTTKADRVAFIAAQQAINGETWVAEVSAMKLWVFGDAAVMRADHKMPGNRRPPYRATRLWVKRDGHWLMAMSQQTTIAGTP